MKSDQEYLKLGHLKRALRRLLNEKFGKMITLFAAYLWWSVFWGFVWFWPKWRRFVASFREKLGGWFIIATPFAWLIIFMFYITFYLMVPFNVAVFYGIFGGGIYQYRKHRKLAMRSD